MGGWSVSGLCLSAIFPTCALMHAVWASYAISGQYHHDVHGFVIDWLSVPGGLYFLWVVRSLYRDALHDWNEGSRRGCAGGGARRGLTPGLGPTRAGYIPIGNGGTSLLRPANSWALASASSLTDQRSSLVTSLTTAGCCTSWSLPPNTMNT
jgi:hypothetical protein